MRIRSLLTPAAAVLTGLLALGCGNTSNTGGGAKTTTPGENPDKAAGTFKLKGPLTAPTVKQGEKQVVNLTVDRDSNFKLGVKLDAKPPKGLKVDMASKAVAAGDKGEVQLTVEAEKDAPIGEHVIQITGTPDAGAATTLDMKVKVEAPK